MKNEFGIPESDEIETECCRLGHGLGWRLFTCPQQNIRKASVVIVSINPAGNVFEPPRWSVESGSAYVQESWKGLPAGRENLQVQFRRMCEVLSIDPSDVLSGYLVPFRSPIGRSLVIVPPRWSTET